MNTGSPNAARSRTAFLWVGLIVPLAIIVGATAVIAAWLPELPDPVATHWGVHGVDGFGPRWIAIALPLGVGGGLVALLAVMSLLAHRLPQSSAKAALPAWGSTARFLGGVNLGLALFLSFVSLVTSAVQRGLTDAGQAPDISGWVLLGLVLLAGGTAVGWLLQPQAPQHPAGSGGVADVIALSATQRAAWFGTAAMARAGVVTLGALLSVLPAATVFALAGGDPNGWILAAVAVVLIGLVCTMLVFRVRVNADGLRVRSVSGWPSIRIPLDRIRTVEVVDIVPMAEFGGWGWRIAVDGRRGVVLRAGEALQVTQRDDRIFVVTVDGARDAAAVLETLRIRETR
ncbi:DUF1648 domain-containing protein [Microbacterium sp. NPDC058345]|uniref:DUF1648 domain-containing protein n=1 Tax=Microbacterium sp. NPDC058345 TaxID=3346455 RepID=UPI00366335BC